MTKNNNYNMKNKYNSLTFLLLFFVLINFNVFAQESPDVVAEPTTVTEQVEQTEQIETVQEAEDVEATEEVVEPTTVEEVSATTTEEFISESTSTEATTTIFAEVEIITATNTESLATTSDATTSLATSTLPTGTSTIDTGDAVALANVINLVNTNTINSTGTVILGNLINGSNEDLDFRPGVNANVTTTLSTTTTVCTLLICNGVSSTTIYIVATTTIQNDIVLEASSGENTVDTAEFGIINTGDTLAGLNLVNVVNTNIVDSNYLLLSLNSFNDINGDIILPTFSSNLVSDNLAINELNVNSVSNLENNLEVTANTGENDISETQNAIINSGSSNSVTNVYNNINTLLAGGNSISILLKITGEWIGELLGLPDEATFVQEGDTRILNFSNDLNNSSGLTNTNGILEVNSTNTSSIVNNLKVNADSGNNNILNTENGNINTGNSLSAANVINIANTNIIGRNWILAIINIFGNFNGNIVFAGPKVNPVLATSTTTPNTNSNSTLEITPIQTTSGNSNNSNNTYIETSATIGYNNSNYTNTLALENTFQNNSEINLQNEIAIATTTIPQVRQIAVSVFRNMNGNMQELKVKNLNNEIINNASFEDILYSPSGVPIKRERWDIGDMLGNEEITLTYEVVFSPEALTGNYSFSSEFNFLQNGITNPKYYQNNGNLNYEKVSTLALPKVLGISTNNQDLTKVRLASVFTPTPEEELMMLQFSTGTLAENTSSNPNDSIFDNLLFLWTLFVTALATFFTKIKFL